MALAKQLFSTSARVRFLDMTAAEKSKLLNMEEN